MLHPNLTTTDDDDDDDGCLPEDLMVEGIDDVGCSMSKASSAVARDVARGMIVFDVVPSLEPATSLVDGSLIVNWLLAGGRSEDIVRCQKVEKFRAESDGKRKCERKTKSGLRD